MPRFFHRLLILPALLAAATAPSLWGQASEPRFEVASVKPSGPNPPPYLVEYRVQSGEFRAISCTLERLLAFAWNIRLYQIEGGPKWRSTETFDGIHSVTPKLEAAPSMA